MQKRLGMFAIGATAAVALLGASSVPASAHAAGGGYTQNNLVADQAGRATLTDPNLVNAWGISRGPNTPIWVSNAGTSTSTLYAGAVDGHTDPVITPLVVSIPAGPPTGQVFNDTTSFDVPGTTTASKFIFAGLGGAITAWAGGTVATVAAQAPDAIYTGLGLAHSAFGPLLVAADFHDTRIDVFNASFQKLADDRLFADPRLPRGFAPFNLTEIGNNVFVTYAKQDKAKQMDVPGRGNGFVDEFTNSGAFIKRFASGNEFKSPWGLTIAPPSFGRFSNDLLVGNFGDGTIHAFNPTTGRLLGTLTTPDHRQLVIPGLWALLVGDASAGGPNAVWFSAGPDGGQHGLLGTLTTN
jgi:uncharacterized protein (TIGR03118 family)